MYATIVVYRKMLYYLAYFHIEKPFQEYAYYNVTQDDLFVVSVVHIFLLEREDNS